MNKLISMTDFVLEQKKDISSSERFFRNCTNYANFLKQPLKLEMFVPVDNDGNVLDAEPCSLGMFEKGNPFYDVYLESKKEWGKAKEKVLFVYNLNLESVEYIVKQGKLIEHLSNGTLEIQLTESALKQIGL